MEIWHALQEELNRLYEMFVQRNPYFETNGGKVSIVAHSLGCVVTYDILTGWTQDVEHSWYNLQTRGGGNGMQDLKRSRHFRRPSPHGQPGNLHATPAQSGLLFRIENFFCLGTYKKCGKLKNISWNQLRKILLESNCVVTSLIKIRKLKKEKMWVNFLNFQM